MASCPRCGKTLTANCPLRYPSAAVMAAAALAATTHIGAADAKRPPAAPAATGEREREAWCKVCVDRVEKRVKRAAQGCAQRRRMAAAPIPAAAPAHPLPLVARGGEAMTRDGLCGESGADVGVLPLVTAHRTPPPPPFLADTGTAAVAAAAAAAACADGDAPAAAAAALAAASSNSNAFDDDTFAFAFARPAFANAYADAHAHAHVRARVQFEAGPAAAAAAAFASAALRSRSSSPGASGALDADASGADTTVDADALVRQHLHASDDTAAGEVQPSATAAAAAPPSVGHKRARTPDLQPLGLPGGAGACDAGSAGGAGGAGDGEGVAAPRTAAPKRQRQRQRQQRRDDVLFAVDRDATNPTPFLPPVAASAAAAAPTSTAIATERKLADMAARLLAVMQQLDTDTQSLKLLLQSLNR